MSTIIALHLGPVRTIGPTGTGAWWDKTWESGFCKDPQAGRCWLRYQGFRGDEQADRRNHGGPDKAVCVYPVEHYAFWRDRLARPDLAPGAFGENLSVDHLLEPDVCIGDVFSVGEALVQVSQPRQPCWKLARRWRVEDLAVQAEQLGFTGFYFRVLRHGWVQSGDALIRRERLFPQWTIEACNQVMHHRKTDHAAARVLSECPALSASWKDSLHARTLPGGNASSQARTSQPEECPPSGLAGSPERALQGSRFP